MLQIIEHPVNLVKVPFLVVVLNAQLVAVGLADGAVLPCPLVPDVAAQIGDPVGLFLPDPQKLIHRAFPVGAPQGHNGKFLGKIVSVHHAEGFDGVGGSAVSPVGAHLHAFIGIALFQDFPAGCLIYFIRVAHWVCLLKCLWNIIPQADGKRNMKACGRGQKGSPCHSRRAFAFYQSFVQARIGLRAAARASFCASASARVLPRVVK